MKVYVLTLRTGWADYQVIGVFSTKKKAEKCLENIMWDRQGGQIKEILIDQLDKE